MTFRTRLLLLFGLAVAVIAVVLTWAISEITRNAFERVDEERTRALVAQFEREYALGSQEVIRRVEAIASSDAVVRMAAELSRPGADPAPYVEQAAVFAREQALELLDLAGPDGAIISSAHYPARFGYKKEWLTRPVEWKQSPAFVVVEELPEETAVALVAVRAVSTAGGGHVYVAGGQRLDKGLLESLATQRGITAVLQRRKDTAHGPAPAAGQAVRTIPLRGLDGIVAGTLVLFSTREELRQVTRFIRWVGLLGAFAGVLLAAAFGWWATARVTRPVQDLAAGARQVAQGRWDTKVAVTSGGDEIGELARAFNQMTRQLIEQRDRLLQVERVAAWRELARRLAHELKNPLFPLQITVENLQRARDNHPEQFDEVFRESTATLLEELSQLKSIIGRFSDFARMPTPRYEPVHLAQLFASLARLFEPQWQAPGRPPIAARLEVADDGITVEADPDQLSRALRNLILNAMDAMPSGGELTLRAAAGDGAVTIQVSDSGSGLTPEECDRLFTPYYTTKQHGTGLGLAIAQSVVSDHGGKISVDSAPGQGTTFRIVLPQFRASA